MRNIKSEEEFRKLQFTGRASYVISLPKRWVKTLGLEAGDQIAIRLHENSFVLTPGVSRHEEAPKEATIIVKKEESTQTILRKIISLYLVGYEIIHIISDIESLETEQIAVIKDVIHKRFIGAEIALESDKKLSFQVLLGSTHFSAEHALRRMTAIISSMFKDILMSLNRQDEDKLKSVRDSIIEIKRLSFYIVRQLKISIYDERLVKRIGLHKQKECLGYRIETKNLYHIAKSIVKIVNNSMLLRLWIKNNYLLQDILNLTTYTSVLFEEVMRAHFKRDFNMAEAVISKAILFESKVDERYNMFIKANKLEVIEIIEQLKLIAYYCKEIAEILLNRTIEDPKGANVYVSS